MSIRKVAGFIIAAVVAGVILGSFGIAGAGTSTAANLAEPGVCGGGACSADAEAAGVCGPVVPENGTCECCPDGSSALKAGTTEAGLEPAPAEGGSSSDGMCTWGPTTD